MFEASLMRGQRILVTGGGTGLGRAMAERFLSLGADVAICGRRQAAAVSAAGVGMANATNGRVAVNATFSPAVLR